jgi:hypothetical protein
MKMLLSKVGSYRLRLIGEFLKATDQDIKIGVAQPYPSI